MEKTQEQDVISQLRKKLEDYIMSFNQKANGDYIQHKGNFCTCISPDHPDSNPSMSIGGDGNKEVFHCFGCGLAGNIFQAAHYLEGLPIHGPEFFTQTLVILSKRYGIPYEPKQLSDSEKERIMHLNAIRDASQTIVNFALRDWNKDPVPEHVAIIKARCITEESVKAFRIGSIPSMEEYRRLMLHKGWDEDYLTSVGLLHDKETETSIFVPGKLIMTISDYTGRPVAFVARKHNWNENTKCSKYVNSRNVEGVYNKSATFFGLDLAKAHLKGKPLYIVEGYIDAITLRQAGLPNVVALGSAGFSKELLTVINDRNSYLDRFPKRNDFKIENIVLSYDGDEAGTSCSRSTLELFAEAASSISIKVKQLPNIKGYHDPDEIIRSKGIDGYRAIEEASSFKWELRQHRENGSEPEEQFVKRVCMQIATIDSPIERRSKSRDLHEVLSIKGTIFTVDDIVKEVEAKLGEKNSKMNSELEAIFDTMMRKRQTAKGTELIEILSHSYANIKKKHREYNQRFGNVDEVYKRQIEEVRKSFEAPRTINGFRLTRFKKLEKLFDGFPDKECLFAVAGDANIGKSTWIREVSWDLAQSNPDAVVLYMSIDDSAKDVLQAIVAREAEVSRSTVYKYGSLGTGSEYTEKVDEAWVRVLNQTNYIVADATQGSSIMHLEDHLAYIRSHYTKKKPIIFLDNFHKLRYSETGQIREKFIDMVQSLKELTQIEDIPIVMTVELRKTENGKRPTLNDIAETKQIEYDAKVVMMAYQDMHVNPDTMIKWHRDTYGDSPMNLPYLELSIAKNKHTDKKCWVGYRFEPDRSILTEVEYETEIQPKRFPARNANH